MLVSSGCSWSPGIYAHTSMPSKKYHISLLRTVRACVRISAERSAWGSGKLAEEKTASPKTELVAVRKTFATPQGPIAALEETNLQIATNGIVCIVGPSGHRAAANRPC